MYLIAKQNKLPEDLNKQVHCGRYTIQLDENSHISNISQFMVFSTFHISDEIHKELLLCDPLKKSLGRKQIFNKAFNKINVFLKHLFKCNCSWSSIFD